MLQTPCHEWHVQNGARMAEFAGWHMPVQYRSIVDEHNAVRCAAGIFDIAHMGRILFEGSDARRFLDYLLTNNVKSMVPGRVRYALVTNPSGGILDDVLVYRLQSEYLLVVNASNRQKILHWIEQHHHPFDVITRDVTQDRFMVAVQGPKAEAILKPLVADDISQLKYYWCLETRVLDSPAVVSRTGYTGEDGFEVILPAEKALDLWQALIDMGQPEGLLPCGLGARDTLRLEAGMPLYGHELTEQIDPFTAGLDFAVKLDAGNFIGRDALVRIKEAGPEQKRVGLVLETRRIAREGTPVLLKDQQVGVVTSGTFSPTLQQSIAMAYVPVPISSPGILLSVDIRGKRESARVVGLPFYKRTAKS